MIKNKKRIEIIIPQIIDYHFDCEYCGAPDNLLKGNKKGHIYYHCHRCGEVRFYTGGYDYNDPCNCKLKFKKCTKGKYKTAYCLYHKCRIFRPVRQRTRVLAHKKVDFI